MDSHSGGKQKVNGGSHGIARGPEMRAAPPPKSQAPLAPMLKHAIAARVIDQDTQLPVSGAGFEILDEAKTVVKKGQTDWQGVVYHEVPTAGAYTIKIIGPAFDEPSLRIVEKPSPGFDNGSLKFVVAPPPRPPGFDAGSLKFVV